MNKNNWLPQIPFYLVVGLFFSFALWSLYTPLILNSNIEDARAADTYTICASGCHYTSLTDAQVLFPTSTDIIVTIGATYVSSTETDTSITLNQGGTGAMTLQCTDSSTVFGSSTTQIVFSLATDTTISGCTFHNVKIGDASGSGVTQFTLENNTFSTSTGISYLFEGPIDNFTIQNNVGLGGAWFQSATNGTISGNTFHGSDMLAGATYTSGVRITRNPETLPLTTNANITVTENTFEWRDSLQIGPLLSLDGPGMVITSNTLNIINATSTAGINPVSISNSTGTFAGNLLVNTVNSHASTILATIYTNTTTFDTAYEVYNNTFILGGLGSSLKIGDIGTNGNLSVTSTYNTFYSASTTSAGTGLEYSFLGAGTITTSSDYNGYWNLSTNISNSIPLGANSITADPFFTNTSTYSALSEFSAYLDVNGTTDIGHLSQSRVGTIPIGGANLVPTYNAVSTTVRSGDTLNFADGNFDGFTHTSANGVTFNLGAGTYGPIAIVSSDDVTVDGVGATSIINAGASQDALTASSSDNLIFLDAVVQNASTTASNTYTITHSIPSYSGNEYGAVNSGIIKDGACSDTTFWASDGEDISNYLDGTSPVHLFMGPAAAVEGARVMFWVPDQFASNQSELLTICSDLGFTVEVFVENVFTASGGVYTYDSSVLSDNGVTITTGTNPPEITTVLGASQAGIKLLNSDSASIANVTSTNNGYAVWFSGTSNSNNINTSTFSGSTSYDVYADGTGDNQLSNVSFDTASSSIASTGLIDVYFRARVFTTSTDGAVAGTSVVATRGDSGDTANFTAGSDGYSPYSDLLLAYTMSSSSVATTNGGYNPWSFVAAATSTYSEKTVTSTLDTQSETVTITMTVPSNTAPTATSPAISGTLQVGNTLTGTYTYADDDSDAESGSTYRWLYSDTSGGSYSAISGATSLTYTIASTYGNKYIKFEVTPNDGTDAGTTALSSAQLVSALSSGGGSSSPSIPSPPATSAPSTVGITAIPDTPLLVSIGNTSHTVTASAPDASGKVTITIQSDPTTITLKAGEEQLVDTNKDNIDDLFVRLTSATDTQVKLTIASIPDLEFSINQARSQTDSQDVTIYLNSPDATLMAVSEKQDFSGASFEPYMSTKAWTLTPGNGIKTVYAKLRTANGGEKIVSDTITLTGQSTEQIIDPNTTCPLTLNHAYKSPNDNAVYYITEANNVDGTKDISIPCTKRAFTNSKTYFTYFTSWADTEITTQTMLESIPDNTLGFMPAGSLYNPKYGALVKVKTDPKVYLLLGGNKHWITSEVVFEGLNYAWNWIEDVAESLLSKYTSKGEITYTDRHPNYTLIKYPDSPKVYRLEPDPTDETTQVKRHVADEQTFNALNFRWDRIVTISKDEMYEDGEQMK